LYIYLIWDQEIFKISIVGLYSSYVYVMSVDTDILIIGAGSSGIAFAVQLQKQFPGAGYEILEKADNLGGTWWVNTYPGCGCDVSIRCPASVSID
jgi:ribulose 1,5-bisphosphate synthetase/thiazole synthase